MMLQTMMSSACVYFFGDLWSTNDEK